MKVTWIEKQQQQHQFMTLFWFWTHNAAQFYLIRFKTQSLSSIAQLQSSSKLSDV